MPRLPIDYSKTIIYKICCNDVNIKEVYVGHTTDLVRRRQNHKDCCKYENRKEYNTYKYKFIRDNGGWENWSIVPVEDFPCENVNQATIRERYWVEELKPELNKHIPSRSNQEWGKYYYEKNKDKINERHRNYNEKNKERLAEIAKNKYEENKDKINERKKEYREINKERLAEIAKKKYEENKQIINEKRKEKFTCECGSICRIADRAKHFKSKKHQEYLSSVYKDRQERTP